MTLTGPESSFKSARYAKLVLPANPPAVPPDATCFNPLFKSLSLPAVHLDILARFA